MKIISRILAKILIGVMVLPAIVAPMTISVPQAQAAAPAPHVVISEVQIAGSTVDDEFVELYNPTSSPITMVDWRISRRTAGGTESILVDYLNGTIPAYGYFLIGSPEYTGLVAKDVTYSTSGHLANNNTVILYRSAAGVYTIVDKLGYGSIPVIDFEEAQFDGNPSGGGSLERKPGASAPTQGNGLDIDNNSVDFVKRSVATGSEPQNSASAPENPAVPQPPTALTATGMSAAINLSWTKSADDGAGATSVTGYAIYRTQTPGVYSSPLVASLPAGTTSYSDTTATPGTNYYYKVEALGTFSSFSNEVGPVALDNTPPTTTIINLASSQPSVTFNIDYTGSDVGSGIDNVTLWYRKDAGAYVQFGTTFTSSPISFNSGATGGDGTYEFYTIATDRASNVEAVPPTPEASTTISTITAPTDLTVIFGAGGAEATLSWPVVSGAVAYQVKYSSVVGTFGPITVTDASTKITGLLENTDYTFSVAAVGAAGQVSSFFAKTATTPAQPKAQAAPKTILAEIIPPAEAAEAAETPKVQVQEETTIVPVGTEGKIKAEETQKPRDWTRIIVTTAIIIIALGAIYGGYTSYRWWSKGNNNAPKEKPRAKASQPKPKNNKARW